MYKKNGPPPFLAAHLTYLSLVLSITLLVSLYPTSKAVAQGNLIVMPKRVVFEGASRSGELNLANTGKDTARYTISLVHYRMKDDGSFEEVKPSDSSNAFADPYIRFFPRSVTLAPNESQVVRIQLIKSAALENGEYRSHLFFRAVPVQEPLGSPAFKKADPSGISVQLKAVFGIAVPVIIRVGASTTQVQLSKCAIDRTDLKAPLVKLTLDRSGNMSIYGDITIEHVSVLGAVTKVATLKGLAVYTPNALRNITLRLDPNAGVDYNTGKLHIVYQAQENSNQNTIAQTELYLN